MSELPVCPHCGATESGFVIKGQARGPAQYFYNPDGSFDTLDMDATYTISIGTVRCGACLKIRRDVARYGNAILALRLARKA